MSKGACQASSSFPQATRRFPPTVSKTIKQLPRRNRRAKLQPGGPFRREGSAVGEFFFPIKSAKKPGKRSLPVPSAGTPTSCCRRRRPALAQCRRGWHRSREPDRTRLLRPSSAPTPSSSGGEVASSLRWRARNASGPTREKRTEKERRKDALEGETGKGKEAVSAPREPSLFGESEAR